jgi:hypothetical protein
VTSSLAAQASIKKWYDAHPEARPLYLAYDLPLIDPRVAGIEYTRAPVGPVMNRPGARTTRNWPWGQMEEPISHDQTTLIVPPPVGPLPGWFAISANQIHRYEGYYEYFLEFEPIDMVGATFIYHITRDEADQVRKRLGMEEIQ